MFNTSQTSAINSTLPRYSKYIRYSAIIRGRIVGRIVAQYSTRGRVKYLYFKRIWQIVVESNWTEDRGIRLFYLKTRLIFDNRLGIRLDTRLNP